MSQEGQRKPAFVATVVCAGTLVIALSPIFGSFAGVKKHTELAALLVVVAETAKLVISFVLESRATGSPANAVASFKGYLQRVRVKGVVAAIVPSVLYLANNNLRYIVLTHLSPEVFTVVRETGKLIFSGIIYQILMGRRLTNRQWICLLVLCTGVGQVNYNHCKVDLNPDPLSGAVGGSGDVDSLSVLGLSMTAIICINSALAGVYTEKIFKKGGAAKESLNNQNIVLYAWSIVFSLPLLLRTVVSNGAGSLFKYWTPYAFLAVACEASAGLLISMMLKYSTSLVKVLASSVGTVITLFVSTAITPDSELSFSKVAGTFTIVLTVVMYGFCGAPKPAPAPSPLSHSKKLE